MFTLETDTVELNECLRQTKRIKWNFSPLFTTIHSEHTDAIDEIVQMNNFAMDEHATWKLVCMWAPKEMINNYDVE